MKAQHLLASVSAVGVPASALVAAFRGGAPRAAGARRSRPSSTQLPSSSLDAEAISELQHLIADLKQAEGGGVPPLSPGRSTPSDLSVSSAAAACGMPWTATMGRSEEADPLLYMPFFEWQLEFMQSSLTNLHAVDCTTVGDVDVSYNANTKKRARIVNQCYASDEYRKIRMTYYDAGDSVQVFNSVWYPDAKYDLPILGIDLLSFNRKKYLAIVDFQPLHREEGDHASAYEHLLAPIKDRYQNLKGRMSSKFYDETQFFSKEMLFARFENGCIVQEDLFPAFQAYVKTHLDLVHSTPPATGSDQIRQVFDRHRAYDTYSAERDPAAGLFAAMFGKEWADIFIHDFLFSLSERMEEGSMTVPTFGGPPNGGSSGGPPVRAQVRLTSEAAKESLSSR